VQPPTPTVPPIAARHALKRLLTPLPPWIRSGPTTKARVAITIDDMWGTFGADNAMAAMDVAKAKGVKLSFFPTGGALEDHINLGRQAVWQRAVAEGHDIGNHTYTHTALTKLTDDQIRGELGHTRDLLAQCLGTVPYTMRLMRPPGGAGGFVTGGDPRIMNVVSTFGYSMTMWTVDANGVKGNPAFINKVMNNASNGMIVLIHFTEFTPDGFPTLIDRLRNEKKLEPTSVTGLFN
jgi:peptidoglycan/xylan/chitin deacetylase (PgdA/CDA1 family)